MLIFHCILAVLVLVCQQIQAQEVGKGVYEPKIADLYITVNARYGRLELNWRNFNYPDGYIVLAGDPSISSFQRKQWINQIYWEYNVGQTKKRSLYSLKPTNLEGRIETDVTYNRNLLNQADTATSCYGYYGYFVDSSGTVQSAFCMKLYPTWMNDLRGHLGKFRLPELFIPGTHDSAAYRQDLPPILWNTPLNKYTITQDDSIRGQLLQGVRYFDLRPAYYFLLRPPFYANHGPVMFYPLKVILDQVRDYALETNEIIILDAHEFPVGFINYKIHDMLIRFLKESLSDVMADPAIAWDGTLEEIWAGKRTVILSYNDHSVVAKYPDVVWSPIKQMWGDVQSVTELKKYLDGVHQNNGFPNRLMSDMAELTPKTVGPGLREMGDAVNRNIAQWYFEEFGPTTNVVAVDFLKGTSIVDVALYWNLKRKPMN